ncbi:type III-B CRISPR module RAMP protein Cmr1 [Saccharolobus islandicus]|uniref:type III-B CRISPR module RAMP protein Cmr1 n=1 Tax=Saccharolobus islandicus TaxID=43080 RepID=UPI00035CA896|nr:type III-B CRISPR module RAMP protein Cmr1 [Sulfolobus islandicus]
MEELLMSLKLKALYPLTGGYNGHSINPFYEEFVRPTEIKGLWRWWNRVLFNTIAYATEEKLYTYESIDRLFEDVFGGENMKSAVRLEVITDGSDNRFELPNIELDKVIECIKNYKGKIEIESREKEITISTKENKLPIYLEQDIINEKIKKDIVDKNKLLKFELQSFDRININSSNKIDVKALNDILRNLIIDYLEYFNIKPEVVFTLNIYFDKKRGEEKYDKFRFALISFLVFIILGAIGRKVNRGFGGLSIVDIKCYDEICKDIEDLGKELTTIKDEKVLREKLMSLLSYETLSEIKNERVLSEINYNKDVVYFINRKYIDNFIEIKRVNGIEKTLGNISEVVLEKNECINDELSSDKYSGAKKAFLLAFGGYRGTKKEDKEKRVMKN